MVELRRNGFAAWGLDPGRFDPDAVPPELRPFFREGRVQDKPFDNRTFDFVYAFDVIEHVGCRNFGTVVTPTTRSERQDFMRSCLEALKPAGRLVLTTSNKLCPIDVGHWHKFHALGRAFPNRQKLGVSIPWSAKNFLLSLVDIQDLVAEAMPGIRHSVVALEASRYPSISVRSSLRARVASHWLRLADLKPFKASMFGKRSVTTA